jgi:hypothetical protein
MTLKELQQMIKEELDTYMNEETVSEENTQEAMAVNVDADDVDAGGDMKMDDSMEMLRKIYDMLKDKFEDMDDMDDDMDMDEDDMMESEETVAEEAVEEAMEKDEDDKMEEGMKDEKDEDMKEEVSPEITHLQERFQKLANIIK